jgi:predicted GIY-YIG superfamily endonuclease
MKKHTNINNVEIINISNNGQGQTKTNKKLAQFILNKENIANMKFEHSIESFEKLINYLEMDRMVFQLHRLTAQITNSKDLEPIEPEVTPILNFVNNKAVVYMIINKVNYKIYIGKSQNLYGRIKNYSKIDYLKASPASKINKAIIKFGYKNFSFVILEYCTYKQLAPREQYFIQLFKPQYNIRKITCKKAT